eukprot:6630209-Pyramimonas_sp.AAC.1
MWAFGGGWGTSRRRLQPWPAPSRPTSPTANKLATWPDARQRRLEQPDEKGHECGRYHGWPSARDLECSRGPR